jgi:hypothetical protein
MVDCTKHFTDLTLRDVWGCVTQSSDWEKIASIPQRIKDGLLDTTFGDIGNAIGTVVLVVVVLPAQLASYLLPLLFFKVCFQRLSPYFKLELSGNENKSRAFWGLYLIVVGASKVLIYPRVQFMLIQGGWEVFVGAVCLILGPKWWGTYKHVERNLAERS